MLRILIVCLYTTFQSENSSNQRAQELIRRLDSEINNSHTQFAPIDKRKLNGSLLQNENQEKLHKLTTPLAFAKLPSENFKYQSRYARGKNLNKQNLFMSSQISIENAESLF